LFPWAPTASRARAQSMYWINWARGLMSIWRPLVFPENRATRQ